MIGLKIAATGALVWLFANVLVAAETKHYPGHLRGIPILAMWFGGAVATVVGFLMAIWQ